MRLIEYIPKHNENRMKYEGDVVLARKSFLANPPANLQFLLEKRYGWINNYIKETDHGIQFGSGPGYSRFFIRNKNYLLTDYADYPWLDHKHVDAMNPPYTDSSFDFIIAANVIHHLAYPVKFFKEAYRILKPGGLIFIIESNASFFLRLFLRRMKHEGYSFKINVFDENQPIHNPDDCWSGNNAVSNLLFDDEQKFYKFFPYYKIERNVYTEFITLLNSGGTIAKTNYIPMPQFLLKINHYVDKFLIGIAPTTFALQRQLILKKIAVK